MIYRIKPWFQRLTQPLVDFMVARRLSPNWLTFGAVGVAAVMAVGLWLAQFSLSWLWLTAFGAPVRLVMNALDGQVARGLGVAGPWGEVKNELSDRLADMLVFGAVALFANEVPLWLRILALVVAFLAGYVGVLGKAVAGEREYGGWVGKPERMVAVALGCVGVALSGWWEWMTLVLAITVVGGIITVILRLRATYGRLA